MAHVLVIHSSLTLRVLLELDLELLGHTVVPEDDWTAPVDIALVEATDQRSLDHAHKRRAAHPGVPIVVVSPQAPSDESRSLEPTGHLQYPISLAQLEQALTTS